MRGVWVIAAVLLAGEPALADPPSLDDAIAQAAREHKPLVIELGATWCGPCRYFQQSVLTRADVKQALERVVFVQYDIDIPPGDAIADRLGVTGVPTILALDTSGNVTIRHSGVKMGADAHVWFLELLARAPLARAVATPPVDPRERDAYAAAKQDEVDARRQLVAAAVMRAEEFLVKFPDSQLASVRLAALALSGRVSSERLQELAKAHLDAVADPHWPDAVRAAMLARANDVARESIEKHVARDPKAAVPRLMRAEASLVPGGPNYDYDVSACADAGNELWCYLLQQRFHDPRGGLPPATASLRERAVRYLVTMDADALPKDISLDDVGAIDVRFGNAVGAAFARARLDCGYLAAFDTTAFVVLGLTTGSRFPTIRVKTGGGRHLERCIRTSLASAPFPEAPSALGNHMHGTIVFTMPTDREPKYRVPARMGVMPQLVVRQGAIETYGLRGDFAFAMRRRDPNGFEKVGLLGGLALEIAGADTGNPAYVAQARVGAMGPYLGSKTLIAMLSVGAGVSDLGTQAPRTFEIPVGVRLRLEVGTARIHAWVEQTLAVWGQAGGSFNAGSGVSFELAGRRLFLGGAYEQRSAGDGAMFTFGVPIGDVY